MTDQTNQTDHFESQTTGESGPSLRVCRLN